MYIDMVGYTALGQKNEPLAMELLAERNTSEQREVAQVLSRKNLT